MGEQAKDLKWVDQLRFDGDGLIPAVIQDIQDNAVLMVGYMNRESLSMTVESGQTWFWSRSRQQLWHKGETSGHFQHVKKISYDCDGDTLLIHVEQIGPACHTGARSCFYRERVALSAVDHAQTHVHAIRSTSASDSAVAYNIFDELTQMIRMRYIERPEGAYTTYLFDKGLDKMLKKVGEEAAEVIIAAKNATSSDGTASTRNDLSGEAADLLFHLCVLLQQVGLSLEDVAAVLQERFGKTHSWQTARNQD